MHKCKAIDQRKYINAIRHSYRVKVYRVGLSVLAIITSIGFILLAIYPYFNKAKIKEIKIDNNSMQKMLVSATMSAPVLQGYDSLGKEIYRIEAKESIQDYNMPDMLRLNNMQASFVLKNNDTINLSSNVALFNSNTKKLSIPGMVQGRYIHKGEVTLFSLTNADIDTIKHTLLSEGLVKIENERFNLVAYRLSTMDNLNIIKFANKVQMKSKTGKIAEISSDSLIVDRAMNTVKAKGNAVVTQGEDKVQANEILLHYTKNKQVDYVKAHGDVFVNYMGDLAKSSDMYIDTIHKTIRLGGNGQQASVFFGDKPGKI